MLPVINWPEEAIKPLSIVDTNKARSHKRGTHISNPFCSVLFSFVAFALTWISVTTGHSLRRASLAFISRHAHTGVYPLSSPLATRRRIRPPKVKGPSRISLVPTKSIKKARGTRKNEVFLAGDRRGWIGSQPFFRSCGGDRSSRGIVRTSAQ
jgi:hypothetical protein